MNWMHLRNEIYLPLRLPKQNLLAFCPFPFKGKWLFLQGFRLGGTSLAVASVLREGWEVGEGEVQIQIILAVLRAWKAPVTSFEK